MKIVTTPNMPNTNGHYSQCISHNGFLFLSGQLPIENDTKTIPPSIEGQTNLVLSNIENILREAGSSKIDIIQVRIYISNIDLWDQVNDSYSLFFENHKPVRSIIPSGKLHFGCLLEIEVTAILNF
ncbi:MAG: 2-iminobutanoate/2-iminopropanoate deaminase [Flavobacteriaceae bacterium]|jgi:2-iminobutanoate/2-iminopropanoate deaminase|tara:strand:- start:1180 stop:1557 length:378 start_codon:yes stop_codon:yes gene_type:complete